MADRADKPRAADDAAQIGHNGGPRLIDLVRAVGPKEKRAPVLFGCGAPWTAFAKKVELLRLARLQARIEMREQAIAELRAERTKIMMRCVRRMRRSEGKN